MHICLEIPNFAAKFKARSQFVMENENRSVIVAIATVLGTIFTGLMLYFVIVDHKHDGRVSDSGKKQENTSTTSGTVKPTKEESQATILLFETEIPYFSQTCFWGKELRKDDIKANWDEGRQITSVAYTKNGWFVTMAKNCGLYGQTYYLTTDWPKDWVKEQYNEGKRITALAFSGEQWMIVFSNGSGYSGQSTYSTNWTDLKEWLYKMRDEGYFITNACYDSRDRRWRLVASQDSEYRSQGWFFADSRRTLNENIKETVYDKGYRIHLIEFGEYGWFCCYGNYKKNEKRGQKTNINPVNLVDTINVITEQGYRLSYVGGSPKM